MDKFAEKTGANKNEYHVASHIKTWKRHNMIVSEMRKESEVGWDEVACKVITDDDAWERLIVVNILI